MTVFVVEVSRRGKAGKPSRVTNRCQPSARGTEAEVSLWSLVQLHPEAIYYSDDPEGDFGEIPADLAFEEGRRAMAQEVADLWHELNGWIPGAERHRLSKVLGLPLDRATEGRCSGSGHVTIG